MLRQLLMLPLRLGVQILEVGLVTCLAAATRVNSQMTLAVSAWMSRFRSTAFALVTVLVTFFILLWASVFVYWSFYYAYVPAMSHTKDVNFIFSSCETGSPCSFPSANMSLVQKGYQNLLMRGQQYTISLQLDMPESPSNRQLGMFMVRLDLYAKHGEVVRSAQRAAMLAYKSTIYRIAETIFFLPLLLYSYTQQKQYIPVLLFNSFVEDPYRPIIGAFVTIESRFIELYKATLYIEAHFTGLRYILYAWPLTSALFGIAFIQFFLCLIVLLSWYNLFWSSPQPAPSTFSTTFTGSVPTDLTQPDNLGSQTSHALSDLEEVEEVTMETQDGGKMDTSEGEVDVGSETDLLTLRQRNVPNLATAKLTENYLEID